MAERNSNDDMHFTHEHGEIDSGEVPPTLDSERPPQRNDDNATGTCTCPCACSAPNYSDEGSFGGCFSAAIRTEPGTEGTAKKTTSEAGNQVDDGDEGTGDHLIEVGDLGFIPISLIRRILTKHARCTCHCSTLPRSNDYPFTNYSSPITSGIVSPGESLIVEFSSGELSMASSSLLSLRSRGSSVAEHMHGGYDHDSLLAAVPLLHSPLQLTANVSVAYPTELSISSDDFTEYEMW